MQRSVIENQNIDPTAEGWQEEWPTQPGTLWLLYGWRSQFCVENSDKPDLMTVAVWKTGGDPGTITFVADGAFLYKSEGATGLWKQIEVNLPPREMVEKMRPPLNKTTALK